MGIMGISVQAIEVLGMYYDSTIEKHIVVTRDARGELHILEEDISAVSEKEYSYVA